MKSNKEIIDRSLDELARKYEEVLKRNGKGNGRINIDGLSNEIMAILDNGMNGQTESRIQFTIEEFFNKRIRNYDLKAGEIASRTGNIKKHEKIMADLRGFGGMFNKKCIERISNEIGRANDEKISTYKALISPELVNKDNVESYTKAVNSVKKASQQDRPDNILESKIMKETANSRNTRKILIDSVREKDNRIMQNYDDMIAYYLLLGGDNPVQRFSRVELSMKSDGIRPDMGSSIMKYGDKLTSKLEELVSKGNKSPKEWEVFKEQVLHSFTVAENIGNRNVNRLEHEQWEERLVRLGILERRLENNKQQTLRESIKVDINRNDGNGKDDDRDDIQGKVYLDSALLKNAQCIYNKTGAIPMGYKLGEKGKLVVDNSKKLTLGTNQNTRGNPNRLSATRGNLTTRKPNQVEVEGR